jgi:predicted DNA-binding protein
MPEWMQISARIPREHAEALERRAEASDRTLSAELRQAIRFYMAELEKAHEFGLDAEEGES